MNTYTEAFFWHKITLILLVALGLALGLTLWRTQPDQVWTWLAGALSLPLFWGLMTGSGMLDQAKSTQHRQRIYNALLGAGALLLGALLVATFSKLQWLPDGWSARYGMLTSAIVLIIIGNGLPKKVDAGCPRTRSLSLQRLFGWTFVIGGVLLAAMWLSPLATHLAMPLSFVLYALMFVVCLIGWLRIMRDYDH